MVVISYKNTYSARLFQLIQFHSNLFVRGERERERTLLLCGVTSRRRFSVDFPTNKGIAIQLKKNNIVWKQRGRETTFRIKYCIIFFLSETIIKRVSSHFFFIIKKGFHHKPCASGTQILKKTKQKKKKDWKEKKTNFFT